MSKIVMIFLFKTQEFKTFPLLINNKNRGITNDIKYRYGNIIHLGNSLTCAFSFMQLYKHFIII